jgi:uncharacterized cupin superfamily protein
MGNDKFNEAMTRAMNNIYGDMFGSSRAQYHYYHGEKPGDKNQYFYTAGKTRYVRPDGKELFGFLSGVYKYTKKDNSLTPKKVVRHGKKKLAIARAYKLSRIKN